MGSSNNNASREAQRAEDQRRAQVAATQARIEQIYSDPARAADIADVESATRSYLQGDLDRQNTRAQRQLKFALARDGQTMGSVDANRNRQLAEDYLRSALEVERRAQAAGNTLRQADQSSKLNLFNMATAGLGMTTAERQAGESMRNNIGIAKADAMQSGLGELFGDLGTIYKASRERAGQRDAQKYGAISAYAPLQNFTGLGSIGW